MARTCTTKRITHLLETPGKSVAWLARTAQIGRSTLGRSLMGERDFRREELERIAVALGIEPKELASTAPQVAAEEAALATQVLWIQKQFDEANEARQSLEDAVKILRKEHADELHGAYARAELLEGELFRQGRDSALRYSKIRQSSNKEIAKLRRDFASLHADNRLMKTTLSRSKRHASVLNDRVVMLSKQLANAKGGAIIAGLLGGEFERPTLRSHPADKARLA